MSDPAGNVLGIRLRRPDGFKFAVRGSKEGLFIPSPVEAKRSRLLICEGPTDTAALMDMGFANVVGRPSCAGGIKLLVKLVRCWNTRQVVIFSDGDEPGQRGAAGLASALAVYGPAVRVIRPPEGIKDARDWLRSGARRRDVEEVINAGRVLRLVVRRRGVGDER
jgi:DNA primase